MKDEVILYFEFQYSIIDSAIQVDFVSICYATFKEGSGQ